MCVLHPLPCACNTPTTTVRRVSATIPTIEPPRIVAGDTAKWLKQLPDYPASAGWVLSYRLINAASVIGVSSTASGADHLVNVPAATTAAWAAGSYDWRAQASLAGEVYTVGAGRVVVEPAFGASPLDARSQARRMLDAIEATLEGRASSSTAEYEIAGRRLKHIPIPELLVLRDRLRADVAREDAATALAAGQSPRGRISVRFGA